MRRKLQGFRRDGEALIGILKACHRGCLEAVSSPDAALMVFNFSNAVVCMVT